MTKYYFYLEEAKKEKKIYHEVAITTLAGIMFKYRKELALLYKISKLYHEYLSSKHKNTSFIEFLNNKNVKIDENIQEIIKINQGNIKKILMTLLNKVLSKVDIPFKEKIINYIIDKTNSELKKNINMDNLDKIQKKAIQLTDKTKELKNKVGENVKNVGKKLFGNIKQLKIP
jgi:hypothetical protein